MENLNQPAPTSNTPVESDPVPTPINPVPMTSNPPGVPGFSLDAGLAERVSQATKIKRRFSIKPVIIIVLGLLFLGSGAYAWFFTDLKYKLPWFKVSEDKLVGMMYDNLAKLDGVDFALTYKLSVGDRDADVKVDEKKVSDYEARNRVMSIKYELSDLASTIIVCFDGDANIQAFSGQLCDGSQLALPKAGEKICSIVDNNNPGIPLDSFGSEFWPDLSTYDWAYDSACQSQVEDGGTGTWSFSAHSNYNDDKISCTRDGCVGNDQDLMDFSDDSSLSFDLLFGTYLDGIDNYISTNFNLEAKLSGSGFSLKEREEKQQLPNVGVGFDGRADLGSMSGSIKMESRVINDAVYYKVDAFPVTDITQGHEGEWIKVDLEDDSWTNEMIPEFSDDQNKAIVDFRNFIAKTKDYNVLTFKATGKYLEKDGVKSPIFEVSIIPENVPNWLQDLRKLYEKDKAGDTSKPVENKVYTEAEKNKIVTKVKDAINNIKIKAALNPYTGDLMNLTVDFRIIPPASSKKFATKQFNSSLSVDLWNHNRPTAPKLPDKFIEQSEIERESLGYSKEAYQDIKQSRRIQRIRDDLRTYYNKHQAWPQKLSDASKAIIDFNTGKEYPYQVSGSNYSITYQMSDVEQKADPKNKSVYYYIDSQIKGFGNNEVTNLKEFWDKGENKADRYSPVAHKYTSSRQWLVDDTQHFDSDVLQTLEQASIIHNLSGMMSNFYTKNHRYPDSLTELYDTQSYYAYASKKIYYACEDLSLAKPCEYQKRDDDYSLKVNYPLSLDNIDKTLIAGRKYNLVTWQAGLYEYNSKTVAQSLGSVSMYNQYTDSDMDGLLDTEESLYGTDKYNRDSDGDGFLDGAEVDGGYNPNGAGKLGEDLTENIGSDIIYPKVSASDWVKGDSKASVILIIYSDADCPYCARFHETANQALNEYTGKLKVVYRHFPLSQLHPEAPKKAEAIECVGELGGNSKVWEFLDELFATDKPKLVELGDTVASLGIDKTKFQTCLDSGKYASKINTQSADAQTAGAKGTPYSLLIKGNQVFPINGAYPYADVKKNIDNLLK